ncbi:MAG TPA: hypothetical protein PLB93_01780 [Candidatus Paceibacterota bacterium]|jgi:hypothetical protein|nr:hypothetical protein [Candidatus Paceibacterota bacterium]
MDKIISFIRRIRSKKEETRKMMLAVSMIVSMSLVGLIWVVGITNPKREKDEKVVGVEETLKPFSMFGESIKDKYQDLSASLGDLGKTVKNIKEGIGQEAEKEIIELDPIED